MVCGHNSIVRDIVNVAFGVIGEKRYFLMIYSALWVKFEVE